MLYRLIVVDDENIIREGIANGVPWEEWGFEVVGKAENGCEAIDVIQRTKPDIILTDIKMPKMDGIELVEYLYEHHPETKILILSGYSEIEYLRSAIKNKVMDYLLKPTDYEEFENVFKKLKIVLDQEKEKRQEYNKLKQHLIDSLPYMREKFLNQLVKGYYKDQEIIKQKQKFYQVELEGERLAVIIMEIDNYHMITNNYSEEQKELLKISIGHIANRIFSDMQLGVFSSGNDEEIIGICSLDAGISTIISAIQEIQKSSYEFKKVSVSAGISGEGLAINKLSVLYGQAFEALKQKVFLGSESIICFKDIAQTEQVDYTNCVFNIENIINLIFYSEGKELSQEITNVFQQFENKMVKEYDYIDKLCLELLFVIGRHAQKFNIRVEDILECQGTTYFDVYQLDSLSLKRDWLLDILYALYEKVQCIRRDSTCKVIEVVKGYIRESFCDNGISLEFIAEKVNKNSAYLSKLFKSETGQNFSEYVTRLRINKARELLNDVSLRTYEIAEMIGYADVSYFTKIFKKHTGTSPSEYRELLTKL